MRRMPFTLLLLAALPLAAPLRAHAQSAQQGEAVFKHNCAICHTVDPGKNKIGPSLAGVFDRKAGSAPGYTYSEANKKSGLTWDEPTLDKYLTNPRGVVPGTKMLFPGLKNADDRHAVIAYLKQESTAQK